MKTIELHPIMQTEQAKYLSDIYFEESKMNKFRDNCIHNKKHVLERISVHSGNFGGLKMEFKKFKKENFQALFCK